MINVTKTYLPNRNNFDKYVDKIYETSWLTNNGQLLQLLEQRLREYLGVKNLLLVSNGTLALQIAYKLLNLHGEIITTPFTFAATSSSAIWEGLKPIFIDINKDTFCMDYKKIEDAITEKTSAIVPVHVFGNACEVEKIDEIAKKHNLKVIYDAAHAFGVKYKNRSVLSYGDISTISFHSTKLFHTIEGGALIIKDDELYERAKLLINFGINGPDSIVDIGINCKMNEFQAAMGLCVLDDIGYILDKRKAVREYYMSNLSDILCFQNMNPECTLNYAYFPVILKNEEQLLKVKKELNKENIFPRRYFYPSLDNVYSSNENMHMEISNDIASKILCLPMYDSLLSSDLDKIINIINKTISECQ